MSADFWAWRREGALPTAHTAITRPKGPGSRCALGLQSAPAAPCRTGDGRNAVGQAPQLLGTLPPLSNVRRHRPDLETELRPERGRRQPRHVSQENRGPYSAAPEAGEHRSRAGRGQQDPQARRRAARRRDRERGPHSAEVIREAPVRLAGGIVTRRRRPVEAGGRCARAWQPITCTPGSGTPRRTRRLLGPPSWLGSSTRWTRTGLLILGSELVGLSTRARLTSSASLWLRPMRVGPAVGAADQAALPTVRKAGEVSPSRDTARVQRGRKGRTRRRASIRGDPPDRGAGGPRERARRPSRPRTGATSAVTSNPSAA